MRPDTTASCPLIGGAGSPPGSSAYFPPPAGKVWTLRQAAAVGMDSARLARAVSYALASESPGDRDLAAMLGRRMAGDEYGEIMGPMKSRGGPDGLILRHGYRVAEWGDTRRVDMTFSVSKSFLSALAGVAVDRGLIADVDDPVRAYVPDRFESAHNAAIRWRHLLQQTSEWEGELWGKPDVADRRRGRERVLHAPGSFWEYNDVRVNLTSLALLYLWRRPLPAVLREEIMDPIGASSSWEWHGYRTSTVILDGRPIESVSGGGHWGGGVWIGSRDEARFGLLYLRRGCWAGARILSEEWIRQTTTPSTPNTSYGYMWWLNTERKLWPSVPESSYAALGGGTNAIWIDPADDLVVVVRWIDGSHLDGLLALVRAALTEPAAP